MVCVLEVALRRAGYRPLPHFFRGENEPLTVTGYFWIADRNLGFRNRALGSFRNREVLAAPLITTDAHGYRTTAGWSEEGHAPIVAFVGDSTTFCAEVEDSETGPSEVARLLGRELPVRVLNAGVRGYNTVQAKRALEELLSRYSDVRAAVYLYTRNDDVENLDPVVYYPARAPTMWRDPASGEMREVEVTDPAVPWGESFAGEARPRALPARLIDEARSRSALVELSAVVLARWTAIPLAATSSIALENGSVGPLREGSAQWAAQLEWARKNGSDEALEQLLREMHEMCAARGVEFLASEFGFGEPHPSSHFADLCRRAGVRFASLTDGFPGDARAYTAPTATGYDWHYGPDGTKAFARVLVPELRAALRASHPAAE